MIVSQSDCRGDLNREMSVEELREILLRWEAIPSGVWHHSPDCLSACVTTKTDGFGCVVAQVYPAIIHAAPIDVTATAKFIAHSHHDIHRLLLEVARLRERVARDIDPET
jgi:hypothetical protein